MNPILFSCYNRTPDQLELSKLALASIFAQDIPTNVIAIDNGSTGETWEWLNSIREPNFTAVRNPSNTPPTQLANYWFASIFRDSPHLLGVPNDVILPPNLYREFLRFPRGIVTGSMTAARDFPTIESAVAISTNTPLAVALIRRFVHSALIDQDGYCFDTGFVHYASDCDFSLRIASCGITGVQTNLPYYHYGSASWRLSDPFTSTAIVRQADADRDYFVRKWGFSVSDPRYGESCGDINFLGASR